MSRAKRICKTSHMAQASGHSVGSLNTSRINKSNEYLNPTTSEPSRAVQDLCHRDFQKPLVGFPLDEVYNSREGLDLCSWLSQVGTLNEFLNYCLDYLQRSGKWAEGKIPAADEVTMKDLMNVFAEKDATFEMLMGRKTNAMSDGRIVSIADRIPNRHVLLYNPNAHSTSPDFISSWLASVNKDDRGFLDNMEKFLVATTDGIRELGKHPTPDELKMAYTMAFYILFVADFVFSSYTGDIPEFDEEDLNRRRALAIRRVLADKGYDVLFIQEPVADLEEMVAGYASSGQINASYQTYECPRKTTAIIIKSSEFADCSIEMIDSAPYLEAPTMFSGFTALLIRRAGSPPYILLSIHARSNPNHAELTTNFRNILYDMSTTYSVDDVRIGMDANVDLLGREPGPPTSVKIRSFLQYQFGKALREEHVRKDFIISYRNGEWDVAQGNDVHVEVITDSGFDQIPPHVFLPTADHPFDHYLVSGTLPLKMP